MRDHFPLCAKMHTTRCGAVARHCAHSGRLVRGTTLTDRDAAMSDEPVLSLQQLVAARMDERGWAYSELERRADGRLSKGRWQQIGSGHRIKEFPEPSTLMLMADVLEVDITTVVLAAAQSVELPVRRRETAFGALLPAGIDDLSPDMRDSLLTIIRAAVREADASNNSAGSAPTGGDAATRSSDTALEWRTADAPISGNDQARIADNRA